MKEIQIFSTIGVAKEVQLIKNILHNVSTSFYVKEEYSFGTISIIDYKILESVIFVIDEGEFFDIIETFNYALRLARNSKARILFLIKSPPLQSIRLLEEFWNGELIYSWSQTAESIIPIREGLSEFFKILHYSLGQTLESVVKDNNKDFNEGETKIITEINPKLVIDLKVINNSILERIKSNPQDIYKLSSRQFEEFSAELFEKQGYNVTLTKATHDGGKDIILAHNSMIGNFLIYIECKKYRPNRPIGVHLIRELVGSVEINKATSGILLTTSYFSPHSYSEAEKVKNRITLIDFENIKELITKI